MAKILEKQNTPSAERYYGDHYPHSLERKENAWRYSKNEAEEKQKELQKDGSTWKIKDAN